jgi:hypothetical protein
VRLRLAGLRQLKLLAKFFGFWEADPWKRHGSREDTRDGSFWQDFFSALGGIAAAFLLPKKTRAVEKSPPVTDTGPILYHRTEEAERYYRTLYR